MGFIRGAALGAGMMYFFDPERGAVRRANINNAVTDLCGDCMQTLQSAQQNVTGGLQSAMSNVESVVGGGHHRSSGDQQNSHQTSHPNNQSGSFSAAMQNASPMTWALMGVTAAPLVKMFMGPGSLIAATLGAVGVNLARGGMQGSGEKEVESNGRVYNKARGPASQVQRGNHRRRAGAEMKVSEIMTPSPACCLPETSLREVAEQMVRYDCGAIPVIDAGGNHPIGIITDRDITVRSIAEGKNPLQLKARDCMTSPVDTVYADASIEECCNRMESAQIRRMLVIDHEGKCIGVVSQADIAMFAPDEETVDLVKDVSTPAPMATI